MGKPVKSLQALEEFQLAMDLGIRRYRCRNKDVSGELRHVLRLRSAKFLNAANFISRVKLAECLTDRLQEELHKRRVKEAFFVTLISSDHAVKVKKQKQYDVQAHRDWIAARLTGLNFVGVIEAGYYPAESSAEFKNGWVSWHAHVIVWGASVETLRTLKAAFNAEHSAFRNGAAPFHFRRTDPTAIEGDVAYFCKSPKSSHHTFVPASSSTGDEDQPSVSRSAQNKRPIRKGHMIAMLEILKHKSMDELCVAGGDGVLVVRASLRGARRILQEDERARNRALRSL